MEVLKKVFPAILDMKNAKKVQKKDLFQNSANDRMTHFDICVVVKRCRDNNGAKIVHV